MAASYPKTNRDKADLYVNAIHEIRVRLRSLDILLNSPLAELVQQESCYLQLRQVCECFAVACLAAQGDFETHKAFSKSYSPLDIFKALAEKYPNFFPTPSNMQKTAKGWHFDDVGHGQAITRAEIEDIWKKSGDHLHRASASKYIKRTNKVDFEMINEMKEKFWSLLTGHMIILADHSSRFHARVDRMTDAMSCQFLNFDVETGSATVEPYVLET